MDVQVQALQWAQASGDRELEAYVHLALVTVHTAKGELQTARQHLAGLRLLGVNPHVEHLRDLRTAALAIQAGQGTSDVAAELATLGTTFEVGGRMREAAWTWLQAAEASLALAQPQAAEQALSRAVDARHAMHSGASLVPELRSLPRLLALLEDLPVDHYATALQADLRQAQVRPMRVHLQTLGTSVILVDGQPVALDYTRGMEILTFLLRRPRASAEDVITALFDQDPKRSRNYFHQVRYDLAEKIQGLTISASPKRTYEVKGDGVQLTWDVQMMAVALAERTEVGVHRALDLYAGPFLPRAEGEWVQGEREDMAWKLIQVGLELMEDWSRTQQYEKCVTLAGRLLEVDPFDESVNAFMIRAVHELGEHPARQAAVARLRRRFEAEMGELPPALLALQREPTSLN
ncbi:hypothetical protein K7W42_02585 [Deinococcus sp. HMF7604]|uniref:AfsR/SARP family transcriptional regulator n=1 Tax=Deinococcus betulae TaxID=2873312 RepID=UPI001CCD9663|nr:hypothetical protein [Deinococcus betulae]